MFYRLLLTYFFRCRYLPSVLAAASLPSQSALFRFVLQVAFVDSANFQCNFPLCAPQFSLYISLPLSVFELRLSTFSMSFSSRYVCVCACLCVAHTFLAICCAKPFSKSMRKLSSQRGRGGAKAELSIGPLFRRKLALQIAAVAVVVVVVNYTHVACQLICQVAAGKSVGEKVKQFAIKSTLNLHSSTWGSRLGYLVSSLSKIYDLSIFHSPPPLHPPSLQLPISDRDRSTAFPTQENWRKINL